MTITVTDLGVTHERDNVVLRAGVVGSTRDQLWFRIPREFGHMLTDRIDPFAVGLLLPAMRHGHDLELRGTITEELLFHLNHDVQSWVRSVMPVYSPIRVSATDSAPAHPRPAGVATGFSGGIDSFSLIDDYLLGDVPAALRITHLLYNGLGPDTAEAHSAFEIGYANVKRLADGWQVPIVPVRTNLDDHFTGTNTAIANTVTARNAAVAHALAQGVGRWYHASSVSFDNARGGRNPHMSVSDVISLPLLSTSALTLGSAGSERSRVRKTLQVMRMPDAPAAINVCIDVRPGRPTLNCSRCQKCVRTLTTLEIAGRLDEVHPRAFDVDIYRTQRNPELALLLQGRASVDREVIAFAHERGWRFPRAAVRQARVIRWKVRMRDTGHAVKQRMLGAASPSR